MIDPHVKLPNPPFVLPPEGGSSLEFGLLKEGVESEMPPE